MSYEKQFWEDTHECNECNQLEKQNHDLRNQLLKGSVELETANRKVKELEQKVELLEKVRERLHLTLETTANHTFKLITESESRFYVEKQFDSAEACQDYIDAAEWAVRLGRDKPEHKDAIKSAENWLNKEPIERGPERSDYVFDMFKGLTVKG